MDGDEAMAVEDTAFDRDMFDQPGNAALFDGVLSRRFMAFLIDFSILAVLVTAMGVAFLILGIPTLGLLWIAMPALLPPATIALVLGYIAFTMGGNNSATPGMRALGLEVRMLDGRKVYALMAIFHAVAFYFFATVLTPFVVLIGLFTKRRRLLHDFISGTIVVNRDALPRAIPGA